MCMSGCVCRPPNKNDNGFLFYEDDFGVTLGVTLGSCLAYGETLEPYLSQFDVEKSEMASVMGICAGLVGPKSDNVEKVLVLKHF